MKDYSLVAEKWSNLEPDIVKTYFGFPWLRQYLIKSAFGEKLAAEHQNNRFWAEDIFISKYLQNRDISSVLSLCCGFGTVERHFVSELNSIIECVGVDIAEGALKTAKDRAYNDGLDHIISYKCADLNNFAWEENKYDLVIANGALHHLKNLEGVLSGINYTLKTNGILYANECVGASYQDYPDRQLELINAVAYLVPPELRDRIGIPFRHSHRHFASLYRLLYKLRNNMYTDINYASWPRKKRIVVSFLGKLLNSGNNKCNFNFGVIHDSQKHIFLRTDPSEGVRSGEIVPLMHNYFNNVEVHSYGGALLKYALDKKFYENYNCNNLQHKRLLNLLCELEESYIQTKQVNIEYAILIGNKQA
jgi:SAM-dependent methyltransferase